MLKRFVKSNTIEGRSRQGHLISLIASVLLFNGAPATAGDVGSSTGLFNVDASGQANYTMAIEVPPGIQGVQPQVALTYSSAQGNGLLGLGGSLSGLSSISRCGANIAYDSYARPVQIDRHDYFCLNGQRLVQSKGSVYGASGSEYHTKIESFQLVTSHGNISYAGGGTSPEHFSVQGQDGSKTVYGVNADSRITDIETGVPTHWQISYFEDKHGNRIDYTYQDYSVSTSSGTQQREVLPTTIRYGRNDSMNVQGELFIDFIYEDRPDKSASYLRGYQVVANKRLTNVQTRVGSDIVKDYRVSYEQTPISNLSRIKQLTECAGNGNCLFPVTFDWQESNSEWTGSSEAFAEALLTQEGYARGQLVDLNNDGWLDQIVSYKGSDGYIVESAYLRDASGWQTSSAYTLPEVMIDFEVYEKGGLIGQLIDINGDLLPDYVVAYESAQGVTNRVYLNNGNGWDNSGITMPVVLSSSVESPSTSIAPQVRSQLIDMNADGLPDVVQAVQTSNGVSVKNTWINTLNQGWVLDANFQLPVALFSYHNNPEGTVTGQLTDINADGLYDIIQAFIATTGAQTNTVLLGQQNNSAGIHWSEDVDYSMPVVLNDYSTHQKGLNKAVLLDINADGLQDVVQAHLNTNGSVVRKTWLNTGLSWALSTDYALPAALFYDTGDRFSSLGTLIDLNLDGAPDVVQSYRTATGTTVIKAWLYNDGQWQSTNQGLPPIALNQLLENEDSHVYGALVDLNNDGTLDQTLSIEGGAFDAYLAGVVANDVALPTLVTTFSDGYNNQSLVEYSLGLHDDVYQPDADGAYPNVDIAGPALIVKEVSVSDGVGGLSTSRNTYQGRKVNILGYGDLGFRLKETFDERTGIRYLSELFQQWPYAGVTKNYQEITSQNVTIQQVDTVIDVKSLFGGISQFAFQSETTTVSKELDGSHVNSSTATRTVDGLGNTINSATVLTDQTSSYRTTTNTQFNAQANNVDNWLIGLPTNVETIVSSGANPITSNTAFRYADYTVIKKITQPGHDQAVTEQYEYDGFGNLLKTSSSAADIDTRESSNTYTTDGRFLASATNNLGHTALTEADLNFGNVTRTEDANGRVTLNLYDEYGTKIKETRVRMDRDRILHLATDEESNIHNVWVFHMCDESAVTLSDTSPANNENCPDNAAYYIGSVSNDAKSPETIYKDGKHRDVRKQKQGFDGTSIFSDTIYDALGRVKQTSLPYFKGETPKWTQFEYDLLGRTTKVTSPDGLSSKIHYQGNSIITENALNQNSTKVINGLGETTRVIDHLGGSIDYTYDAAGQLLSTMDTNGNITAIEYDDLGRRIKLDDPNLGTREYRYDALGHNIWRKDAKGQIATMEYDRSGRMVKRIEGSGVNQIETVWEYDTASHGIGKLAKVFNNQGYSREHEFDQYSRPIKTTQTIDGESHVTETGYLNVNLDKIDYTKHPSGLMIRKTYNEYGYPLEIRSNGLVEFEEYKAKLDESEDFANQAVVYQDSKAAERAALVEVAQEEIKLGNADQRRAQNEANQGQKHIPEYNKRQSAVRKAESNYFRYKKRYEDVLRLYESVYKEYRLVVDQIDRNEAAGKYGATNSNLYRIKKGYEKQLPSLKAEVIAAIDQVRQRIAHVEFTRSRAIEIRNVIQSRYNVANDWAKKAKRHYSLANTKKREIDVIDDEVSRLAKLSSDAAEDAEDLLAQYNDSSLQHWEALGIDASGRITEFTQGKHVSTTVEYDPNTGKLTNVEATSQAKIETAVNADTYAGSLTTAADWLASLQTASAQYQSSQELADIERETSIELRDVAIENAAYYRSESNIALALLEDAEKHRLDIEIDNHAIVRDLNRQLKALTDSTIQQVQNLQASHDDQGQYRSALLDNRLYEIKAAYHGAVEDLYRGIAQQQLAYSATYRDLAMQTPQGIAELTQLSQDTLSFAEYNASRQIKYESDISKGLYASSEVQNQYTGGNSNAKVSELIADVYQGRAEVYNVQGEILKNIYGATQGVNSVVSQIHALKNNNLLAARYQANTNLGQATLQSYERLGHFYQQRAAVVQSDEVSNAIQEHYEDARQQSNFEFLASDYRTRSDIYAAMAEPVFWQNFFNELADSQVSLSDFYLEQAQFHQNQKVESKESQQDASNLVDQDALGFDGVVLDDTYNWDEVGNLIKRQHGVVDLTQEFQYDGLNRLTHTNLSGTGAEFYQINDIAEQTIEYDALGNITRKSDVGSYEYGSTAFDQPMPHAITKIRGIKTADYDYDANGNLISGDGRTIDYDINDKAVKVLKDGVRTEWMYGPEGQLLKEVTTGNQSAKTVYQFGVYEKIIEDFTVTHKYHVKTSNGSLIAVMIDKESDFPRTNYLHRDHLDSVVAITDSRGFVVERFHYDAFGQRRLAVGLGISDFTNTLNLDISSYGYTGHRMYDELDIIHMKGRIYDPSIGRFSSPDIVVQAVENTQNYNRYSYVFNNPMRYTDPSGYYTDSSGNYSFGDNYSGYNGSNSFSDSGYYGGSGGLGSSLEIDTSSFSSYSDFGGFDSNSFLDLGDNSFSNFTSSFDSYTVGGSSFSINPSSFDSLGSFSFGNDFYTGGGFSTNYSPDFSLADSLSYNFDSSPSDSFSFEGSGISSLEVPSININDTLGVNLDLSEQFLGYISESVGDKIKAINAGRYTINENVLIGHNTTYTGNIRNFNPIYDVRSYSPSTYGLKIFGRVLGGMSMGLGALDTTLNVRAYAHSQRAMDDRISLAISLFPFSYSIMLEAMKPHLEQTPVYLTDDERGYRNAEIMFGGALEF